MSKRSRAVPWFLERPPHYVNERKLAPGGFGEVTVWRDWSWDNVTWFKSDGTCVRPQLFGPFRATPDLAERYPLIKQWSEADQQRHRSAADAFFGALIQQSAAKA